MGRAGRGTKGVKTQDNSLCKKNVSLTHGRIEVRIGTQDVAAHSINPLGVGTHVHGAGWIGVVVSGRGVCLCVQGRIGFERGT